MKIFLINSFLISLVFVLYSSDFKLNLVINSNLIRVLLVSSIFIEFVNYLSFQILKTMIITPIHPKSYEELIRLKFEMEKNNKFQNVHYLQNLIYALKDIHNDSSFILSKECVIELKYKIERIVNELNSKIKNFCSDSSKEQYTITKYLTDSLLFSDLFTKNTSFKVLDSAAKIAAEVVKIFVEKHVNHSFERESDGSISPKKHLGDNQKCLLNFLEILINMEDNLNKLIKEEKFYQKCLKYKKFHKELIKLNNEITLKINKFIISNFKENFLIFYAENIKNRIGHFIQN
jgi:hypothetical protein